VFQQSHLETVKAIVSPRTREAFTNVSNAAVRIVTDLNKFYLDRDGHALFTDASLQVTFRADEDHSFANDHETHVPGTTRRMVLAWKLPGREKQDAGWSVLWRGKASGIGGIAFVAEMHTRDSDDEPGLSRPCTTVYLMNDKDNDRLVYHYTDRLVLNLFEYQQVVDSIDEFQRVLKLRGHLERLNIGTRDGY
jgi:hypothetical protein